MPELLCILSDGFVWESYDSQTFIGAEVFALINFILLLLFAVLLVVLQSGVTEQLGIGELGDTANLDNSFAFKSLIDR